MSAAILLRGTLLGMTFFCQMHNALLQRHPTSFVTIGEGFQSQLLAEVATLHRRDLLFPPKALNVLLGLSAPEVAFSLGSFDLTQARMHSRQETWDAPRHKSCHAAMITRDENIPLSQPSSLFRTQAAEARMTRRAVLLAALLYPAAACAYLPVSGVTEDFGIRLDRAIRGPPKPGEFRASGPMDNPSDPQPGSSDAEPIIPYEEQVLLDDIKNAREALKTVPKLIDSSQWTRASQILRKAPARDLWKEGGQNPIRQLAGMKDDYSWMVAQGLRERADQIESYLQKAEENLESKDVASTRLVTKGCILNVLDTMNNARCLGSGPFAQC